MATVLTSRDQEILDTLARRVRTLSLGQIAREWWRGEQGGARRRLRSLQSAGLVELQPAFAHPEPRLGSRLLAWSPGDKPPALRGLARVLAQRWPEPPRRTVLVIASAATGESLGGVGGRFPGPSETSHDVALAAVFLQFRSKAPSHANGWISEGTLQRRGWGRGSRLPDAVVFQDERPAFAVEFAGEYSHPKLSGFHRFCEERGLPYELW